MKYTLPGQLDMSAMPEESQAKRLVELPMIAKTEQKPCDIGLFSDEANQLDLIEMFMD